MVPAGGRYPRTVGRWPLSPDRWPVAVIPGPLAGGRWPVAVGRWPLAAAGGRWPLAAAGGSYPADTPPGSWAADREPGASDRQHWAADRAPRQTGKGPRPIGSNRGSRLFGVAPRRVAPGLAVPGLGPCFSQIFTYFFVSALTVLYLRLKSHTLRAMFHVEHA
jgi:hypothetical protein